jgi:hypothetical protein
MAEVALLLNGKTFRLPGMALRQAYNAFRTTPLPLRYSVTSAVSSEVFQTFLSALKGQSIEVTAANFAGLSALCREFEFSFSSPSYRLCKLESAVESIQTDLRCLSDEVAALRGMAAVLSRLSGEIERLWKALSTLADRAPPDSAVLTAFPALFSEFRGKRFKPLWRGSRDGFGASDFHRRCDGHANTLTVILDTNGNVFGGFTPVEWESR